MSILSDVRRKRHDPLACSPSGSSSAGDAPMVGMGMEPPSETVDAVDVALARQEFLAAANASTPLGRAIILRLAASIARPAASKDVSANRIPGLDRFRE